METVAISGRDREPSTIQTSAELLERVVVRGNLADLTSHQRLQYYKAVCESVGLNPLTRPFSYITLSGKLTLYANRDATDQLRDLPRHQVSIERLEREYVDGNIYCVTAYAKNAKGRTDASLGAVSLEGLKGEARANALMKCETKAKRRVTLSICGLGMLDETEVETIPGAKVGEPAPASSQAAIDRSTGELIESAPEPELLEQDRHDRSALIDAIDRQSTLLGLKVAQRTMNWARTIGPNVKEEDAPLDKLMELSDALAAKIKGLPG